MGAPGQHALPHLQSAQLSSGSWRGKRPQPEWDQHPACGGRGGQRCQRALTLRCHSSEERCPDGDCDRAVKLEQEGFSPCQAIFKHRKHALNRHLHGAPLPSLCSLPRASQLALLAKNPPASAFRLNRHGFNPRFGTIPWRRKW